VKAHVLIIEDEIQIAHVVKLELEYEGYQVTVKHDGIEGLEAAVGTDFDLLLMDVMLPGLSGLEILRRLRSSNRNVPVIFLTARNATLDIVSGLDLGASDYVLKPFKIEELMARIRACLRNQPKTAKKFRIEGL
jgi:DNA-binding response OmpR family regulator